MKRLLVVFTLLCSIASMGFAAQEDLEIYTYLYDNSGTSTEKFNILLVLQAQQLTGSGEFYARAFNQLVNQISHIQATSSATERVAADDLAQTLATLIGEEKYSSAAPDLWRAYTAFSAPAVKAEVLISLGKLRATQFLPQVVRVLETLNNVPPAGRDEVDANSHIARGAILALEKYRDVSGYLPVFLMSVSGYPKRIQDLAKATLSVILEDPSELLTKEVIRGPAYMPSVKLVALQTIEAANVPNTAKATAAAAALDVGWRTPSNDPRQRTQIAALRKTSMEMIGRYGANDPAVYPLLERCYKEGSDENEKITAVQTLGTLGTEDASKQLAQFLLIILGRMQSNTHNRTDETMMREIIPAIAVNGKAPGRSALQQAIDGPSTTPAIKDLAQKALDRSR